MNGNGDGQRGAAGDARLDPAGARWRALAGAALFALGLALGAAAAGQPVPPVDATALTVEEQDEMGWLQRAGFGAGEANYYIKLLADADLSMVQYVADRYYLFSPGEGVWGNGWLSKFVVYDLGMRAIELGSQLSGELREQLNRLMEDAVDEGTFRVDPTCGIDPWNSCSEDFGSMLKTVAMVRQLFPEVVARVGDAVLRQLEEKFLRLAFSTELGGYALTVQRSPIDGNPYVMMNNHGDQSAVYGGILLTELANALYAYWLSGNPLPAFYRDAGVLANVGSLFDWLQRTATPDGRSYVNGCLNVRREVGPCNDPSVSNAIPRFIPAGRVVRILLGEDAFRSDLYDFQSFDPTYTAGNCWNPGRRVQFDVRNPGWVALRASAPEPASLEVRWDVRADALRYDVWGPAGRVASTTGDNYTFDGVPPGGFDFGVVVRGRELERVVGVGLASCEVSHLLRRRLPR